MSATKSIASMVIGRLLTQGLLDTIDRPAADFLSQWRGTDKNRITLRHILEHTSGLVCRRNTEDIYASKDFVKYALEAELVSEPGETFTYNNRATNLLAEIVRQLSGMRIDEYASIELFQKLGIEEYEWVLDDSGNPHCMSGLRLRASDFATLGQLMLQEGIWEGEHLIKREWVRASTTTSSANPSYSLLWWLLGDQLIVIDEAVVEEWRRASPPVPDRFISILAPLMNRPLGRGEFLENVHGIVGEKEWAAQTWRRGLRDGRLILTRVSGFYASGSGGQFLVVLPDEGIVAARLWAMDSPYEDVHKLATALRRMPVEPGSNGPEGHRLNAGYSP